VPIALALDGVATIAIDGGDVERGVRLAAAADELRRGLGGSVQVAVAGREPPLEVARRAMDPGAFARAEAEGRAMSLDDAVALALEGVPAPVAG
jgi:hypothetical protein